MPKSRKKFKQIDAPHDGSCLFWSVALSILLPLLYQVEKFKQAFAKLFGNFSDPDIKDF